ncbi:ArsR family transcriptional regulator [Mycolicibacterium novocastrense]|uniref:ArsR family transcriptional regulator n=1 Tax=Mycolicibacterium novocastrense TaxID=59813 RepID=A0ABQ0KFA8_MYCNV|nr:ArsR family transcriptional regulator [Mycolicibacterium novocastrense]
MVMESLSPATLNTSSRHELAGAVALFHSLSDPTRLAIARYLAHGEARADVRSTGSRCDVGISEA